MILLDTSGLLASYNKKDRHYVAVTSVLERADRRILCPFVLAELDYMLVQAAGQEAERIMLGDVASGAYELVPFSASDVLQARLVIERYRDLAPGLTDASLVVLADRYGCREILTLDQRHFRAMTMSDGHPFRLLPFDA